MDPDPKFTDFYSFISRYPLNPKYYFPCMPNRVPIYIPISAILLLTYRSLSWQMGVFIHFQAVMPDGGIRRQKRIFGGIELVF